MSKEDNLNQNWKHDFPVKKEQSLQISRRDFAKFLVFISGGLVLGSGAITAEALLFPNQKSEEEYFVCKKSPGLNCLSISSSAEWQGSIATEPFRIICKFSIGLYTSR